MKFRINDVTRGYSRSMINEPVGLPDPGPIVVEAPLDFMPAETWTFVNDFFKPGNSLFMPDQSVILGYD